MGALALPAASFFGDPLRQRFCKVSCRHYNLGPGRSRPRIAHFVLGIALVWQAQRSDMSLSKCVQLLALPAALGMGSFLGFTEQRKFLFQ